MEQNYIDFIGKFFAGIATFVTTAGIRLVLSLILVVVGFAVVNRVIKGIKQSKRCEKTDKSVLTFVTSFASISLKILIILTAASYLGVPMTNLVAIVGSCGLAIGLALQGSLSNLAGGIMILVFKPFKDEDYIATCGLEGTVREITILYTYLVTPDNKTVVIPNSQVSNAAITNYSAQKYRRADVSIGVSYKSDVNKVREILEKFAKSLEYVEKEPECKVVISQYADSAIVFTIRVWTETAHYWDVVGEINYGLQKLLSDNNIEIPYPQLDIHIDK